MKKLLGRIVLVFSFVFVSCHNIAIEPISTSPQTVSPLDTQSLVGYISNLEFLSTTNGENTSSRTIMPELESEYDFYLCGSRSTDSKILQNTKLTLSADYKFNLPVTNGYWNFMLFAVPKDTNASSYTRNEILQKAHLKAETSADLNNNSANIPFKLTPDGLKGAGNVNFYINLLDDWDIPTGYTVSARIAERFSRRTVSFTNGTSTEKTLIFEHDFITGDKRVLYGGLKVAAGTYDFIVTFENEGKVAIWSDIIVVIPNRSCNQLLTIPNVIGEMPENKPLNFQATYIRGSEDLKNHEGFYKTYFTWESSAKNVKHFNLQIADVSDETSFDITSESDWNSLSVSKILDFDGQFRNQDFYVEGSLEKNKNGESTHWVTLYSELGKKYAARIRSANDRGYSAWSYVTIPASAVTYCGNIAGASLDYFENTSVINRYRIKYNLNGGSYQISQWNYVTENKPKIVYSSASTINLWDGSGYDDAITDDDLRRTSCEGDPVTCFKTRKFKSWKSGTTDLASNTLTGNFANLELIADYEEEITPEPTDSFMDYSFIASWITMDYAGVSEALLPATDLSSIFVYKEITKTSSPLKFSVTFPLDMNPFVSGDQHFHENFSNLTVSVKDSRGEVVAEKNITSVKTFGIENTFDEFDISSWEPDCYNITFTGTRISSYDLKEISRSVTLYLDIRY